MDLTVTSMNFVGDFAVYTILCTVCVASRNVPWNLASYVVGACVVGLWLLFVSYQNDRRAGIALGCVSIVACGEVKDQWIISHDPAVLRSRRKVSYNYLSNIKEKNAKIVVARFCHFLLLPFHYSILLLDQHHWDIFRYFSYTIKAIFIDIHKKLE